MNTLKVTMLFFFNKSFLAVKDFCTFAWEKFVHCVIYSQDNFHILVF